jgi:transcriptional regulator with XRE-family HTH domain
LYCYCNSNAISELLPILPNKSGTFLKIFLFFMDSIVTQLIAKRNKLGLSVPKLAQVLGIPSDRIYKWEQGAGNPKGGDIEKINTWLELIPKSSNMQGNKEPLERAIENLTEADLINARNIERLISLLEHKISMGMELPEPGQAGTIPIEREKKKSQ